ncbi:uncharacterized protein LOC135083024 [Ostrinia nubilalis]|uniref:uncharacterized protein LOC135083024 n=1 Tax=Ostrinia nubilalis TaxID=29057 RepID=UPI0030824643
MTTCRLCKKRHHSLLHPEAARAVVRDVSESNNSEAGPSPIVSCTSTHKAPKYEQVLLATALVNIESEVCGQQAVRALIDQGAQACFITEAAVQLLKLKKESIRGTVTGLGDKGSTTFKHVVTITLRSRIDKQFQVKIRAYVMRNLIISHLPEQQIESLSWVGLGNLQLADPQFNMPNKIDLLLGANAFSQILKEGVQKSPDGLLIAQNTSLGWIVSGIVKEYRKSSSIGHENPKISVMHAQINEDDALKRFWEIEEQPHSTKNMWTEEEQKCEENFASTTSRTPEGRYIVKLPFRETQPGCKGGNSRDIAVRKFKSLEKRLSKDSDLKKSYIEVINEYLQLGHMRPVKKNDSEKEEAVYLPHHAVVRNDKTTTKVRVVFNASSKNSFGISLNDTLMVGPKLQADLRHLVLRWREHPIVLVADVVKMYRQVRIAEEDAIFQRIVWRDNSESEIQDFELMTVTFGTASAPYLAVRALHQVSFDEAKSFPLAAPRVVKSFYMDDLMTGCSDVTEGVALYQEMRELLLRGGFQLQKWNSNNKQLLSEIFKTENQSTNKTEQQDTKTKLEQDNTKNEKNKEIDMKADNITKILGITWDRSEDHFRYSVSLPTASPGPETKRSILSEIARLYDPLGWLAPSIIIAKMFIQKLWLAGITWDEPISDDMKREWYTYRDLLIKLTSVRVPRWLGTSGREDMRELHGFSDASKLAYAAVVYLRVVDAKGNVHVSLLAAKTRVSPIKQVSIPRLELCGSTLLARLLSEISEVINIPKSNIKAWTDSTVVLAWLNSHPSKWKTFVANRVSDILTTLDSSQWYHVPTKENPADCASRGVSPDALCDVHQPEHSYIAEWIMLAL